MTVVAVVQARSGSSRLPRKVLEDIQGQTMLARVLARVQQSATVDEVVVATTPDPSDDTVADIAHAGGARVFRGSTLDVLDRFHGTLTPYRDSDIVVRITADCPFVDPDLIDLCVRALVEHQLDFVSNRLPPPATRTYPVGLDVEVATVGALRRAWMQAIAPHHREHVMPYLYESGLFTIETLDLDEDLSMHRWTVDTAEDLASVRSIARELSEDSTSWHDVLDAVQSHNGRDLPWSTSRQKTVTEVDARWPQEMRGDQD